MPDSERAWWLARQAHKDAEHAGPGIAPHPREQCGDHDRLWYPQMTVCHVEMETEAAQAQFNRLHEKRPWHDGTFTDWAEEPDAEHPYHYTHGTRIWVADRDLGFGGNFTTRERPFEEEEDVHVDTA